MNFKSVLLGKKSGGGKIALGVFVLPILTLVTLLTLRFMSKDSIDYVVESEVCTQVIVCKEIGNINENNLEEFSVYESI